MNEQEMFLHYEDALELDWQSEIWIKLNANILFCEWSGRMLGCTSKTAKLLKENEARIKENERRVEEMEKENEAKLEELKIENKAEIEEIKKKFDENKAFFESLMVDFNIA